MLPIALQLYTVRDELDKDFLGTLKKVKEMGYDGVELSGLVDMDPIEVRRMLDEVGLFCNSSHVRLPEFEREDVYERYLAAGIQYIAVPWMNYGEHNEFASENLAKVRKWAEAAHKAGLTLMYHNHDFEFRKIDGRFIFDCIYEDIPAELLQMQLDTCWARFAGEDPCAYLKKYAGRSSSVHLKDYWKDGDTDCVPYDLIGVEDQSREKRREGFEFRPVGHGVQDIPALIRASEAAGAAWLIVEQDQSHNRSSLEAAKMSIDYLHSLKGL